MSDAPAPGDSGVTPLPYARPISADPAPPDPSPPRGALGAIFLIAVMDFFGFGIIIPLLPHYVPNYRENALKVTLLFSVYSICQFIGAPILGLVSDRFGRRPVLALSQVGSAIGYVLLAVAPEAGAMMLAVVYASRIIDGFTGGNISTAQAYISDVTTRENRAKGMGMLGAAFGIGFSLGPATGGVLGAYHISWPAYLAAALAMLAAVLSWFLLKEPARHAPTEAEVWLHPAKFAPILRNPVLLQLLLISFCIMAAFVMMESTLVLFLDSRHGFTTRGAGWFFAWLGLCIVLVQGGVIGRLTKRVGEWPLAVAGPVLVAVGMVAFTGTAWAGGLPLLMLAGAVNATGRSLQQPATSALLSKFSDPREQGAVFGLYHGLASLARVAGPILAAVTYPLWRNTGQFLAAGIIAVAMGIWTALLHRQAGEPARAASAPEAAAVEPA